MSYLHNAPGAFRDEMITGFVTAHASVVRRVNGGVARRQRTPDGQVAVVVGGGSGHYPAFAGLVGRGLAHAAAMGNVFASPSAQQISGAARAVASTAGVLLAYGNYAGDVLNFDQAQDELRAQGIPCRSIPVTDDISSASREEAHRRRGVAGDLVVFKAAAWAAEQGGDLNDVADLAIEANERTRTIAVAFGGATLPGADDPLFVIPAGRMGLGMGIHGEPGLDERAIASADEIASTLVERLLLEAPDDASSKVAVIVNGLGSVKGEELFVFFNAVARLLADHGIEIVEPEVGEFVTSFEMAGVSLTLTWLTDELEAAWRAPAAAPGYRKAAVVAKAGEDLDDDAEASALGAMRASASEESRALAPAVARAFTVAAATIEASVADLGALDSVAGDGDHGIGMQRGSAAAAEAARTAAAAGAGVGGVLEAAGSAWADRAGGTSGALWGLALRTAARRLGDELVPTKADAAAAVTAAVDAIQRTGKAELGDKTMLDAAIPFAQALSAPADGDLADAWRHAAQTATLAADATADLVPRMGRARPHQEKSVGHADPGAISLAMIVTAVGARDA